MANYQNHLVDPTFFDDALSLFSFTYDIYVVVGTSKDASYKDIKTYEKQSIRGSLQSKGLRVIRSTTGNITEVRYEFYCKSLYRIQQNDVIVYKNKYLLVDEVRDYDEHGVRAASLKEISLYAYTDLSDYINYLEGQKLV